MANVEWRESPGESADEIYRKLLGELQRCSSHHVPERKTAHNKIIPRDRRILMRRRRRLFGQLKLYTGERSDRIKRKISEVNRKLKMSIDLEMEREESRAVENIRNPKYFYRYARRKNRTKSAIGPLMISGEMVGEVKIKQMHCSEISLKCTALRAYRISRAPSRSGQAWRNSEKCRR